MTQPAIPPIRGEFVPTSQAIISEQRTVPAAEMATGFPLGPGIAMMTFRRIAQQAAAVRRFAESQICDHPALGNAVLVASGLAANAVAHSAGRADGSIFCVHVPALVIRIEGTRREHRLVDHPTARQGGGPMFPPP
jgi:hypothetical protein